MRTERDHLRREQLLLVDWMAHWMAPDHERDARRRDTGPLEYARVSVTPSRAMPSIAGVSSRCAP